MPQLNQLAEVGLSQLFWLLLTLAVLYFGIGKAMLPKIQSTVDARNDRIAEDLAAAERANAAAEAIEAGYRAKMDESRTEALKVTQAAKAKTARDAEDKLHKADAQIAEKTAAAEASLRAATAAAVADIEGVAAEAAADIVARLTGAKVARAEASKAVKAAMADV
jgi:F-type H+-transporting ATPase subunit b